MKAYLNAHIVDPGSGFDGLGTLLVDGDKVVALGADVTIPAAAAKFDCAGKLLLPGLIDMMVFTGEPGSEYRETLASASEAAAAGGVTTLIVMPNTQPVIDDAAIVDYVLRRAAATAKVRVAPMAAISKGLQGELMSEIGLLKEAGAVAITDATKAIANANLLRRTLTYARDFDMLVVQHVEEPTLASGVMNAGEMATRLGLSGNPAAAEIIMLERDLRLVEMTGARYHAAQISCAESVEIIRRAKAKGLAVSCGVSINHLVLNEHDVGEYRTFFKLSPPLRTEDDRRALVAGIADGTIDVIVSSHNPQSEDTKRLPFAEAAFGAIGLETLLSAAYSLVHSGNVSISRLVAALTFSPASLLGLKRGTLAAGSSADFTIFDPDISWNVDANQLHSHSRNTPFERHTLEGRVLETVVAGRSVYKYSA